MLEKIKEEKKQYCLEIINKHKRSDKIAMHWCKENNINCKSFYRWRGYLTNHLKIQPKINSDSFIELSSKSNNLEVEIEYKKYKFKLRDCGLGTLQGFLKLIKSL